MAKTQKITPALFVQLYMESHAQGHTIAQFAERLGIPYNLAYTRARRYTRAGVRLPKLRQGKQTGRLALDVRGLNQVVAAAKA